MFKLLLKFDVIVIKFVTFKIVSLIPKYYNYYKKRIFEIWWICLLRRIGQHCKLVNFHTFLSIDAGLFEKEAIYTSFPLGCFKKSTKRIFISYAMFSYTRDVQKVRRQSVFCHFISVYGDLKMILWKTYCIPLCFPLNQTKIFMTQWVAVSTILWYSVEFIQPRLKNYLKLDTFFLFKYALID